MSVIQKMNNLKILIKIKQSAVLILNSGNDDLLKKREV